MSMRIFANWCCCHSKEVVKESSEKDQKSRGLYSKITFTLTNGWSTSSLVVVYVSSYLNAYEIVRLSPVCKKWKMVIESPGIAKELVKKISMQQFTKLSTSSSNIDWPATLKLEIEIHIMMQQERRKRALLNNTVRDFEAGVSYHGPAVPILFLV